MNAVIKDLIENEDIEFEYIVSYIKGNGYRCSCCRYESQEEEVCYNLKYAKERYYELKNLSYNDKLDICDVELTLVFKLDEIAKEIDMKVKEEQKYNKTRFGFVPCDYETYLKLKELYKIYWVNLRQVAKWHRWERKDPSNRVRKHIIRNYNGQKIGEEIIGKMTEPSVCETFATKRDSYKWKNKGKDVWRKEYFDIDHRIVLEYQKAKTPVQNIEDIPQLSFSKEDIDKMHKKATEWYNSL